MPKQKDLKRLIRARMEKTGESYATARRQLLAKREKPPRPGVVPAAEYAGLAGMRDEAVRAKTGRGWKEWVVALDAVEGQRLAHGEIAAYVAGLGVPGWWAQAVTVGYERIRGLRDVGQRRGGAYEAGKSKTFAVPVAKLYRAFADEALRERWLPGVEWAVRTAVPETSIRLTWADETRVAVYFVAKGEAKSTVTIQHERLADREAVAERKAWWAERLAALAELLAPSA
jgi:hypothetical protein